jgi:hypothetical protein
LIDQFGEVMSESRMEFPEIRDLGDRVLALGRYFMRGKALRVQTFLDHREALEAAGLLE